MINKHQFKIQNTKKILHKVGKHWVVVSAILLGLMMGGSVVGTNVSHAAAQNQPQVEDHYDGQKFDNQINHEKNIQAHVNLRLKSLSSHKDSLAQNLAGRTSDYNTKLSSASVSASNQVDHQIKPQSDSVQNLKKNRSQTVYNYEQQHGMVDPLDIPIQAQAKYDQQCNRDLFAWSEFDLYNSDYYWDIANDDFLINSYADDIIHQNQQVTDQATQYADQQIKAGNNQLDSLRDKAKRSIDNEFHHSLDSVSADLNTMHQAVAKDEQTIRDNQAESAQVASVLNSLSNANVSALKSADNSAGNSLRKSEHSSRASQRSANNSNNEQSANSFSNYKSAESSGASSDDSYYNSLQGSIANSSITAYYQQSVASSVSSENQSIASSYRNSVTQSVASANHDRANAAAQKADQKIESAAASKGASLADQSIAASYSASVANSVSTANQSRANSAAQSTDKSIANSWYAASLRAADNGAGNSLEKSDHDSRVAKRDQINSDSDQAQSDYNSYKSAEKSGASNEGNMYNSLASEAAYNSSRAASLTSSVANSVSNSVSKSLNTSEANSLIAEDNGAGNSLEKSDHDSRVSKRNQINSDSDQAQSDYNSYKSAESSGASSEDNIYNSLASEAAYNSSKSASVASSVANSVSNSISKSLNTSEANSLIAEDNGAGNSLEKSDHDSRVARRDQINSDGDQAQSDFNSYSDAESSGANNDDAYYNSLQGSIADKSIAAYYQQSVANSVSSENQSLASSYRNSVAHSAASKGASLADQSIAASYANSVANSVSTANQSKADSAAQSADKSIANSWIAASLAAADNGAGNSYEKSDHNSRSARSQMNSDSDRAKSDYDHYKSGENSGASSDDDIAKSLASEAAYNSSKNASIASSVAASVANSMNESANASRAASSAAQSASNHSQPQTYSYSSQGDHSKTASNASQNDTLENAVQGMSKSNAAKLKALVGKGVSAQVAKKCVLLEEVPKP